MVNCPKELGDNRSLQGSGRGRSVAPPLTQSVRDSGSSYVYSPSTAYAMKAREDQDAPEVIVGIFSLYDIEMHALIDPSLPIHLYALSMCLIR